MEQEATLLNQIDHLASQVSVRPKSGRSQWSVSPRLRTQGKPARHCLDGLQCGSTSTRHPPRQLQERGGHPIFSHTYRGARGQTKAMGRTTLAFGYGYEYSGRGDQRTQSKLQPLTQFCSELIEVLGEAGVWPRESGGLRGLLAPPNSVVVEVFEQGDMLPPVVAHHDVERPICVVSLEVSGLRRRKVAGFAKDGEGRTLREGSL